MKKSNGFVFMETIVVMSILSFTLLLLFASYSYILRKSRDRNTFDTTEFIYKTYYTRDFINLNKDASCNNKSGIKCFIDKNTPICKNLNSSVNDYVCSFSDYEGPISTITKIFEIDKIYLTNIKNIKDNNAYLLKYDATTIDYIKTLKKEDKNIIIVKYKKTYSDGSYEVFHSSIKEVD